MKSLFLILAYVGLCSTRSTGGGKEMEPADAIESAMGLDPKVRGGIEAVIAGANTRMMRDGSQMPRFKKAAGSWLGNMFGGSPPPPPPPPPGGGGGGRDGDDGMGDDDPGFEDEYMPLDPCFSVDENGDPPVGCDPEPDICPGQMDPADEIDDTVPAAKKKYLIDGVIKVPSKGQFPRACSGNGITVTDPETLACKCSCKPGFDQGPNSLVQDCAIQLRATLNVTIDCFNMSDTYLQLCNEISHTTCKPYSLTWNYDCFKMCKAVDGKGCLPLEIAEHCSHAPQCPPMCFSMMNANCAEQIERNRKLVP